MSGQPRSSRPAAAPLERLGFVGAGRLAQALAPALDQAGWTVCAVSSRSLESARALARQLPRSTAVAGAQEVAGLADVVFLTVPDAAIATVASQIAWRSGQGAVHCSGAWGPELLPGADTGGAQAGSFHPLQTFAGGRPAASPFLGITISLEAPDPLRQSLLAMTQALGARPLTLLSSARALYHASAVLAGNYLVTLLAAAAALWPEFGLSEQEGLSALLPLVRTTLDNVARLGPSAALTGPAARGDVASVRRHLEALMVHAPDTLELYRQLGLRTLALADDSAHGLTAASDLRELFASDTNTRRTTCV